MRRAVIERCERMYVRARKRHAVSQISLMRLWTNLRRTSAIGVLGGGTTLETGTTRIFESFWLFGHKCGSLQAA